MRKVLDKIQGSPVALYIHTYIHTYIQEKYQRNGGSITRTSIFSRKWGGWYLVSSRPGGCL